MDFSLLYTLLRSICTDRSLSANIERIRIARNQCVHYFSPILSNADFNTIWSTLRSAVMDIDSFLGNGNEYLKEVDFLRHETMDPLVEKHYREAVKKLAEGDEESTDSSNEVANESAQPENKKGSIPQQCIEELEASLGKPTITVQHSRGILVGCAEAGKTTLLKRLMGETQDAVEDIESTRGLEVHHHVFNIRNGCLEVSGDDRQQKAFIRVNMSDLNPDFGKRDGIVEADVSAADLNTNEESSGIQILYEREQDDSIIGNRTAPNEVSRGRKLVTTANSVDSDAKATTTIPRDILLKILDEKEKVPAISMLDLAGQFAYYACHQIYITKRVFFIFVLNVNQKFDDRVSIEENNQEGSVFWTWTYKDYVKFWVTSIKTFGGMNAPVLIVATHTEEKSEDEIDAFFKEFWTSVPEEDRDWLGKALVDSEYDVSLLNLNDTGMETLEAIKKSIIKAATRKISNTIEVRSTWALLEQLVKEKGKEVMSYEEIWDVNTKRLPREFQLENQEMISEFLQVFHDNGLLLWFEEGVVDDNYSKGKVILDIQWFANAVNKLIADKNHIHKDCKRRYYTEWDSFNKTGKVGDKLVNALWQDESSYLDHKTEIMTYMEKLQMAVALHSKENNTTEAGMSWYVPCMNKKIFKNDFAKEKWEYSSILCFRFSSFAMFVYYRVVAYCMSVLHEWTVSLDEEGSCLYQTAAVFDYRKHTVTIGISENDIEVQVKRKKPSVIDTKVSIEVGKSVQSACRILIETFNDEIHFDKGYKCESIICNFGDRSFTPASELANVREEIIQCECCSVSMKHVINVEETLRFWEQSTAQCEERQSNVLVSPLKGFNGESSAKFQKKNDNTLRSKELDAIYTQRWHHSVGYLVCSKGTGTAFRVGGRYLMTAFHVIRETLEMYINKIVENAQSDPNREDNYSRLLQKLQVKESRGDIEEQIKNGIHEWTMKSCSYLKINSLLSALEETEFLYARDTSMNFIKDNLMHVYFGRMREHSNCKKYPMRLDIPFYSRTEADDVAILEVDWTELPKPFNLDTSDKRPENVNIIGHPSLHGSEQVLDSKCPLISDSDAWETHYRADKWWKENCPESMHKIIRCNYDSMINDRKVLFHCSESTTHGASGSPGIIDLDLGKPKVYLMLREGFPKFARDTDDRYIIEKLKTCPKEYLVESGISMSSVYELLSTPYLKELRDDIFHS